jgi:hypothetical protein
MDWPVPVFISYTDSLFYDVQDVINFRASGTVSFLWKSHLSRYSTPSVTQKEQY